MAEYIERESTIELLRSLGSRDYRREKGTIQEAIKMVSFPEYTPSADVAPVVRCQDCKNAWIHPCGYVYCHRDGRNAYEMTFNLDSFCSYGERKDNG